MSKLTQPGNNNDNFRPMSIMKHLKMALRLLLLAFTMTIWSTGRVSGQESNRSLIPQLDGYVNAIEAKAKKYSAKMDKQSFIYLRRLDRIEKKIQRKLFAIDSIAAEEVFPKSASLYDELKSHLGNEVPSSYPGIKYSAFLDSISTSLKFLQSNNDLLGKDTLYKAQKSLASLEKLQNSFRQSEHISKLIRERRTFLNEKLANFPIVKQLNSINKQVYYYNQQVKEYKDLVNDRKKAEAKAFELLSQIPAFKDFMKKHSMLAMMFPGQPSENSILSLQGLQTRMDIDQQFQQRFGTAGIDVNQISQQQISNAQSKIQKLKDKLISGKDNVGLEDMPNFKPNSQKTKSFLKRLEFGGNLQTQKSNQYHPCIIDIGLSLGFKLNDKSVIGIGMAYKLGLGSDIRKLKISHEGIGLRNFLDVKLKYNIWISGGAELNYRESFSRLNSLQNYSAWKRSALVGLTKKYKASNKMKCSIQLLFDFLYKEKLTQSQPFIFRVGYGL